MSRPPNIVQAFSEEQTSRLTGVSISQLRYWDATAFFQPSFGSENRRLAFSRVYSFRDVVCLRVLDQLRNRAGVSLHHLRNVKDKLAHLGEHLWAATTLHALNGKVVFQQPGSTDFEEVTSGQRVFSLALSTVTDDMAAAVRRLSVREPDSVGKITVKRNVAHGRPVVAGTRVPVRAIRAFADAGYTVAQILAEYPRLTEADVNAALEYRSAA